MKIKIYKHNLIQTPIDDDIAKIIPYFKSDFVRKYINIDLNIDVENTDCPKQDAVIKLMTGDYDVVMYCFERGMFNIQSYGETFFANDKVIGIYQAVDKIHDGIDFIWKAMCHEILHSIAYKITKDKGIAIKNLLDKPIVNGKVSPYFGNDNPYLEGGNFEQQLKELSKYFTTKKTYKYFSQQEVDKWKLKPELFAILDKMREIAQTSFIITSGLRTEQQNKEAGGMSNSAHLRGLACDLAIKDNFTLTKMLDGITEVRRTNPCFLEIAQKHLHLDIDKDIHDLSQTIVSKDD